MIRHVVAWKLAATDPEQRAADAAGIKSGLESHEGIVDGMASLSVGSDAGRLDGNWDVVMVSDFDDNDALEAYKIHPDHRIVVEWIKTVVSDRACVDVEW